MVPNEENVFILYKICVRIVYITTVIHFVRNLFTQSVHNQYTVHTLCVHDAYTRIDIQICIFLGNCSIKK